MKPYKIAVPQSILDDLRDRLSRTRWPQRIEGSGWRYGADFAYLRELCDYWRNAYDWRAHEARINTYPQFIAEIDGVDIHFIHVRSSSRGATPLLLLHGWPGSIVEFLTMIGPLSNPKGLGLTTPAFDLVIPCLPGFGFSGQPKQPGWGSDRIAAALHTLMTKVLGYQRFGIQGGDWGTIIGGRLAWKFPRSLIGLHINMPFGYPTDPTDPDALAAQGRLQAETAYLQVQNTKPDTLTMAQSDSPAGLAAWIVEKFYTWGDCRGDVESVFSKDVLLTNLMFYWTTNSATSAARVYFETSQVGPATFQHPKITVPTGVAVFPAEPFRGKRAWVEPLYNIVSWVEMPRGGHFPALETPDLLLADVRSFFSSLV